MSSQTGSVDKKIRMLPPDLRKEAVHYIDELVRRSKRSPAAVFRCAAEGALAELGKRYSSVELQHISFDKDFDRTVKGRVEPQDLFRR